MSIIVSQVSKKFGQFQALDNINLEIKPGKLVALLGPSGSGKSTLLRAIAGLEPPDTGSIIINGKNTTHLDIRKRNIGFVFQHYALFKHLTVRQNISFGLELRGRVKKGIKAKVNELLELIQLEGLGDRYPAQLSGGQRQRVALARALAVEPEVLLLDEPFGALDAKVRKELRAWLRRLHDNVHVTSVFVTHDQEEAMAVADEIVVMNQGSIEQVATPEELYEHPATPFVINFIGEVNVLPVTSNLLSNSSPRNNISEIFVRPHELSLSHQEDGEGTWGIIKRIIHLGWEIQAEIELEDSHEVVAHLSREKFDQLNLKTQEKVFVKPSKMRFFQMH
ncbi:sulfate/molybdate ABC transporter ATP-binding protein [Crocosphaera sp. XPORK-15E]|uniref:sulfate/molybdate ABC transporter ATP-binding protein n=1 Tax=Crocosphaera sp. XPORK-15E TaxID=3110247 RepID=UPI002B21A2CA|nr:sulfate ABC transporter ATP-binding protein [Crocosphaera sp. XPORK-15E]MEA5535177.1 sulfate ABC transporter ATP-binding protein [Crocosphaera sp. XPORK-15E]